MKKNLALGAIIAMSAFSVPFSLGRGGTGGYGRVNGFNELAHRLHKTLRLMHCGRP